MGEGVAITAEDIILSDSWNIVNVLITKTGYMKIKGERISPIDGGLNYASAWIETGFGCELFKSHTGREIHEFKYTQNENSAKL